MAVGLRARRDSMNAGGARGREFAVISARADYAVAAASGISRGFRLICFRLNSCRRFMLGFMLARLGSTENFGHL